MYIIIGQGAAGTSAANRLRELDPATPITIISNECDYFYSRIDLPDIIGGKREPEDSVLQPAAAFADRRITSRMGQTVRSVDPQGHWVELASGERLTYGKLLIATGSQPSIPPLSGVGAEGVFTVWTMHQARQLIAASSEARRAVVIGAGLIGLKTALALAARGVKTTVVEMAPRLLPRQLDDVASGLVAQGVLAKGVDLLLNTQVGEIVTTNGRVTGVRLRDQTLACDMVVMAVGVRPNATLAQEAGLTVKRGIVTNELMETSYRDIYAAGDVAEVTDRLTGVSVVPAIWPAAVEQGTIAAANMAGERAVYSGSLAMNSVEIGGVPLVSVGNIEVQPGDEIALNQHGSSYKKLVLRQGIMRGVLLVGDIRQAGVYANLIERGEPVELDRSGLINLTYVSLTGI